MRKRYHPNTIVSFHAGMPPGWYVPAEDAEELLELLKRSEMGHEPECWNAMADSGDADTCTCGLDAAISAAIAKHSEDAS